MNVWFLSGRPRLIRASLIFFLSAVGALQGCLFYSLASSLLGTQRVTPEAYAALFLSVFSSLVMPLFLLTSRWYFRNISSCGEAKICDSSGPASAIKVENNLGGLLDTIPRYIQVLSRHLEEVCKSTEQAAFEIMGVLQEIQHQSGVLVNTLESHSTKLSHLHESLGRQIDSNRLEMERLNALVATIYDIGRQNKLVALNAAIEAAHVGEAGRCFAVVVEEVRRLAERSAGAAKSVENGILKAREVVERLEQELKDMATYAQDISQNSHKAAEDIHKNILGVLGSLQFQDIVRQRIANVLKGLSRLAERIENIMSRPDSEDTIPCEIISLDSDLKELYDDYVMSEERAAHDSVLSSEVKNDTAPRIELF